LKMVLTELSKVQKDLIPVIRKKWVDFALFTETDEKVCREGVEWLYEFCGFGKPKVFFCDSPLALQFMANILNSEQVMSEVNSKVWSEVMSEVESKVSSEVDSNILSEVSSNVLSEIGSNVLSEVRSEVWDKVRNKVDSEVLDKVGPEVDSKVRNKVGYEVGSEISSKVDSKINSKVRSEVFSKVLSEVSAEVDSKVRNEVRSEINSKVSSEVDSKVRNKIWSEVDSEVLSEVDSKVRNEVEQYIKGNKKLKYYTFSADDILQSWQSFYDYFTQIKVINNKNFIKYTNYLKGCPFFTIYFKGIALIGRNPTFLKRDERNRLHCTTDHAISFRDGYGQHYLHGVYFSPEQFKDLIINKPKPEVVFKLGNVEQRSALIQFYGIEYFFNNLPNKKVIDVFDTFQKGTKLEVTYTLLDYDISESIVQRVLVCEWWEKNEKQKAVLGIPPNILTCKGAVAWTFDVDEGEYWDFLGVET